MGNNRKYITEISSFDFHISLKKTKPTFRVGFAIGSAEPKRPAKGSTSSPPHGSTLISIITNIPHKVSYVNCIIFTLPPNPGKNYYSQLQNSLYLLSTFPVVIASEAKQSQWGVWDCFGTLCLAMT